MVNVVEGADGNSFSWLFILLPVRFLLSWQDVHRTRFIASGFNTKGTKEANEGSKGLASYSFDPRLVAIQGG